MKPIIFKFLSLGRTFSLLERGNLAAYSMRFLNFEPFSDPHICTATHYPQFDKNPIRAHMASYFLSAKLLQALLASTTNTLHHLSHSN